MGAIDLTKFTDPDFHSYALARPWCDGDWVYATDAVIMVRVNATEYPNVDPPGGKVPSNCAELLGPIDKVDNWQSVPPKVECPVCHGTGRWGFECEACEHFHDEVCCYCHLMFDGLALAQHKVSDIRNLPEPMMARGVGKASNRVFFKFFGGVGVLMPREKNA